MISAGIQRRFELLSVLGSGAMGTVYRAFDREQRRPVALKVLRNVEADALRRFKNEFRARQALHHPNLVSIDELIEDDGGWFLVMELVDGPDLRTYVRGYAPSSSALPTVADAPESQPPLDESPDSFDLGRLRRSLEALARALEALHGAGLVHRDIKPANIRIAEEDRLVLLDFGLVMELRPESERSMAVVGTHYYMAPEQRWSPAKVGPAADWYAVGVMLYELITGQFPSSTARAPLVADALAPLLELSAELMLDDPARRAGAGRIVEVLGSGPIAASQRPSAPAFVGRESELGLLLRTFEGVGRGRPACVVLAGISGIGKTTLVSRFIDEVHRGYPGALCLTARCYENESAPYKAFDAPMEAVSRLGDRLRPVPVGGRALLRAFPVLQRLYPTELPLFDAEPHVLRAALYSEARALFDTLGAARPVVLAIDDLRSADDDSLALLRELLRAPDAPRLFVVATWRTDGDEAAELSVSLRGRIGEAVQVTPLLGLRREDSRRLLRELLVDAPPISGEALDVLSEEIAGHPLLAHDFARYARAHPDATGVRVTEALGLRLKQLSPDALRLLQLVCCAGAPLPRLVLAAAAGLDPGARAFQSPLGDLLGEKLVRVRGAGARAQLEPFHDRISHILRASTDREELARLHRALAEALSASDAPDMELVGGQWERCGEAMRAADCYEQAGDRASSVLAFSNAVRYYHRAVQLRAHAASASLLEKLARALANDGRSAEAAATFLQAAALEAPPDVKVELERCGLEQWLRSGHVDEALSLLPRLLGRVGVRPPRAKWLLLGSIVLHRICARALQLVPRRGFASAPEQTRRKLDLYWSVASYIVAVDPFLSTYFQGRHHVLALLANDPFRMARASAVELCISAWLGASGRAQQVLLQRTDTLASASGEPYALALAVLAKAVLAMRHGRWRTTCALSESAATLFRERCRDVAWELVNADALMLLSLGFLGSWSAMASKLPPLIRSAEERGDLFAATQLTTTQSLVWLLRDDAEGGLRAIEGAVRRWSRAKTFVQHGSAVHATAEAKLYLGLPEEGLAAIEQSWDSLERSYLLRVRELRIRLCDVSARCALAAAARSDGQRRQSLLRDAQLEARRLTRDEEGWVRGLGHLVQAGLAVQHGTPELAMQHLLEAEALFGRFEMLGHRAAARWRRGELTADQSLSDESRQWMESQGVAAPRRMLQLLAPGWS
ncbi:protein kinase domain-containing protein [Hyalangium sp.]|uniref:protein kinase domain-containing protein n=1 Tax=Hyalangium sp. TaxID=2028555 RepID=UPI002D282FFA|nr:protein kinase [Hyalangium sp.]HYI01354.1 protein kinase [Hyalangium sp.]